MHDMRIKSGGKKVEQIRATGAKVIASPFWWGSYGAAA
jgi:hypothetical protein